MDLIAYTRVSTDRQVKDGDGLESQTARINTAVAAQGHRIVAWCRDEAKSGEKDLEDRQGLAEAVAILRAGGAQGLIVSELDRLARDLIVQEQLLREIWRIGEHVHVLSSDDSESRYLVRDDPRHPTRTLIRQVLGAVAAYERAMIRMRMMSGAERKAAEGGYAWGRPPYGWRAVGRELVPDVEEQRVLLRVRELRGGGAALRAVAAVLNEEGFRRPGGGVWQSEQVRRALRSEIAEEVLADV